MNCWLYFYINPKFALHFLESPTFTTGCWIYLSSCKALLYLLGEQIYLCTLKVELVARRFHNERLNCKFFENVFNIYMYLCMYKQNKIRRSFVQVLPFLRALETRVGAQSVTLFYWGDILSQKDFDFVKYFSVSSWWKTLNLILMLIDRKATTWHQL